MSEAKGSDVRAVYVDTGAPKCPVCQMPMNGSVECHLPSCTLRVLQEAEVEARVQAAVVEMRERCAKTCNDLIRKAPTDEAAVAFALAAETVRQTSIPTNAYDAALLRARLEGIRIAETALRKAAKERAVENAYSFFTEYVSEPRADLERQLAALEKK